MRCVNRWLPLRMIAFLLIFAVGRVFTGKYIYETAAYFDQGCWGNSSNRPEEFHSRYWGIETGHDLSPWCYKDYREMELIQEKEDFRISAWNRKAEIKAPLILFVHGLGS